MYQLRLFGLLLRPSISSGVLTTCVAIFILAISNWPYLTQNPMVHDYFYGRYGITTTLQESETSLFDLDILDQPMTYYITVVLVAVLASMLVYIVLQGFSHGVAGAKETINEIGRTQGSTRHSIEAEVGTRWTVRITSVILWALYWIFFLNALLPFCLLTSRNLLSDASGMLYSALGFLLLWIGLHQHLVFARLMLLRPRLFGGRRAIDAQLY
jgi:hypothetical protein